MGFHSIRTRRQRAATQRLVQPFFLCSLLCMLVLLTPSPSNRSFVLSLMSSAPPGHCWYPILLSTRARSRKNNHCNHNHGYARTARDGGLRHAGHRTLASANRRNEVYEDGDDDENSSYDDKGEKDNYYDYFDDRTRRRSRRPPPSTFYDDLGEFDQNSGLGLPSSFGRRDGWRLPDSVSKALLAGVFVLGVGLGVTIDSQVNTNPKDLASRDAIDLAAPNPKLCASMGASAMAFDQRVFISFNPFNVYVTQADVKPACVLQQANVVSVLRSRGLISDDEVRQCKGNMDNTFGFVGELSNEPQISCIYKSRDAQNAFLTNPKIGIGEDYLESYRSRSSSGTTTSRDKIVKGTLTGGQEELIKQQQQQQALIQL